MMILFYNDWNKYPTAKPHLTTSNKSYIELAMLYRDMGVKNYFFHLALVDQDLANVNPHSEELTDVQVLKIVKECFINPWYFFREIARAPARGSNEPPILKANRANISLWWCFFNHIEYFLIQPRQTGKSLSTDELMIYLLQVLCKNTNFSLLTKDDPLRVQNIQRIKDLMDDLPRYLDARRRDDANNTETITINARGNSYKTFVPQPSPKRALNLGRGLTTAVFHVDEPPFCVNIGISLPAALASMSAAVDAAKEANAPYGKIFTTTAGKKDDRDGKYIYTMLQRGTHWDEKYLDAVNIEQLNDMIYKDACRFTEPSRARVRINGTFSHRQLGYSDDWLIEKLRESESEGDDGRRDFLNIWTSGTESSPFDQDVTEAIAMSKSTPKFTEVTQYGYKINYYIEEEEIPEYMSRILVAGLDLSEAIKRDSIAMTIVDPTTLKVIATMNENDVNTFMFSSWLADFMTQFENIILVPERKSIAQTIMDYLLKELPIRGVNPFKRIFNMVYQEFDNEPEKYRRVKSNTSNLDEVLHEFRSSFGYTTAGSGATSRDMLYNKTMNKAMKHAADKIYDEVLATQMLQLVIKNGRIDHDAHGNDDQVVSWLLACWFILFAKGQNLYGLNNGYVLSGIESRVSISREDFVKKQAQEELRKQIDELYKRLNSEDNDYMFMKLEQELKNLAYKLDSGQRNEVHTMSELINKAKENKIKRKQTRRGELRSRNYTGSSYNHMYGYRM